MFNFFKEILGPSVFTKKGLLKYKHGKFEESRTLILKAGRWMNTLESDSFYQAALLLVESNLGKEFPISSFREAIKALKGSPYKNTGDYSIVVEDLNLKIKGGT